MAKNPHPSGRPVRRESKVGRGCWNYPPDPGIVYATPRLRPVARSTCDAVGFLRVPASDDDESRPVGFVHFGGE